MDDHKTINVHAADDPGPGLHHQSAVQNPSHHSKRSNKYRFEQDPAVTQINKLFHAIDEKIQRQGLANIVEGSLKNQMFGVFAENYRTWQERFMNADGSM